MHRIYHDFNKSCAAIHEGMWGAPLVCRGTRDDLQRLQLTLVEGMEVLLYMPDYDEKDRPGALEVKATLYRHPRDPHFIAEYVGDEVKWVPDMSGPQAPNQSPEPTGQEKSE